MADAADVEIGARVHTVMWRAKVSQVSLAKRLGMTQTAISRKVRGDRPWFASELLEVASALNVPIADLLPAVPPPTPPTVNSGCSSRSNITYLTPPEHRPREHAA
jgi:transcriptional regulator with XRE-family HTH domain